MNQNHRSHNVFHVMRRHPSDPQTGAIVADSILAALQPPAASLVPRTPQPTSDSSSTQSGNCDPNAGSSNCQQASTDTSTLPIVLGVVIPIICLVLVLIYFHRRLTRKQRLEDLNDKHGSLDFGLGEVGQAKKAKNGKPVPEMTTTEKSLRRGRGMSMDLGNPYLMPGNLQGSRESIHSLSRSIHDKHDPYRPVHMIKETDGYSSYPSSVRLKPDTGSIMTASSGGYGDNGSPVDAPQQNLLKNAQRMSRSYPPRSGSIPPISESSPPAKPAASQEKHSYVAYTPPQSPRVAPPPQTESPEDTETMDTIGRAIDRAPTKTPSKMNSLSSDVPSPSAKDSGYSSKTTSVSEHKARSPHFVDPSGEDYGGNFTVTPPSPPRDDGHLTREEMRRSRHSIDGAGELAIEPAAALGMYWADQGNRRISMGVRPLPPDNMLEDHDPEQRANRIRSFYKEYFDDSKAGPAAAPTQGAYYEDFGEEYLDSAIFDPASSQFVVPRAAPFAQHMGRRAMTPPPRAPPRAQRGPVSRGSANSDGRLAPRAVPPPKKRLPPPSPLMTLPTPHMLKTDAHIFAPIDFAPPTTFRDRQLGRPDSPLGAQRPYSPAVSAHSPLVSSFDDLSVMPSPHMLRKSGTFTALDFAPPPRFKTADTGSDTGSIRSNRSGISAVQQNAIRQGAYRVSRIPRGTVTTKEDLSSQLRPTWDQRGPAHGV